MASVAVDVADAVVSALNADPLTNFGVDFTAERSYPDWEVKLEELDRLRVDVVTIGLPEVRETRRGLVTYVVRTQVGVRKRFGSVRGRVPRADVDELIEMLEKINTRLTEVVDFGHVASEVLMTYDPETLRESKQYTGVLQLNYQVTLATP